MRYFSSLLGVLALACLLTTAQVLAQPPAPSGGQAAAVAGQGASVKLDAYDSSIFGSMNGQVRYISPDILTEETRQGPHSYYRVRILIKEAEFKGKKASQNHLRPGLSASVDIKALDRTVLSYLTKPITKTFTQSLGER